MAGVSLAPGLEGCLRKPFPLLLYECEAEGVTAGVDWLNLAIFSLYLVLWHVVFRCSRDRVELNLIHKGIYKGGGEFADGRKNTSAPRLLAFLSCLGIEELFWKE